MVDIRGRTLRTCRRLMVPLLTLALTLIQTAPALALRVSASYWRTPQEKILLYWIDTSSFPDAAQLAQLRANLEKAADGWENICTECGIRFIEVHNQGDATFRVAGVNVQRAYLADGFNPSDPKDKWVLKIDRSYFSPQGRFDKVGILRHELGHILGYRHEHIMASDDRLVTCGWKTERNTGPAAVIALTDYDTSSLMHYPCGLEGDHIQFDFSPLDIEGHRRLYGPAPEVTTPQSPPRETQQPQ